MVTQDWRIVQTIVIDPYRPQTPDRAHGAVTDFPFPYKTYNRMSFLENLARIPLMHVVTAYLRPVR